jgi:hypothetical protein
VQESHFLGEAETLLSAGCFDVEDEFDAVDLSHSFELDMSN